MGKTAGKHVIGCGTQQIEVLSSFKTAHLSESEKMALVEEAGNASNLHKLDLKDTHYVDDEELLTVLFLDF